MHSFLWDFHSLISSAINEDFVVYEPVALVSFLMNCSCQACLGVIASLDTCTCANSLSVSMPGLQSVAEIFHHVSKRFINNTYSSL